MTAMLPLSLELSRLRIALIGNGLDCLHRLSWLEEAGAMSLEIYAPAPAPELARAAAGRLLRRWPDSTSLQRAQLVFIADVPEPERHNLAEAARLAGAIIHVEDAPALSDVHAPALLRRGDLMLAISTCGAAPGLAAALRGFLAKVFGPEWEGRLDEIRALRQSWRTAGADHGAMRRMTATLLAGWLEPFPRNAANDSGRTHKRSGG